MPEVLDRLREEHGSILRILNTLDRQLAIFERGDRPDYDVLSAAADYFIGFPDRCHHPVEDLLYAKMRERDALSADAVSGIADEHRKIGDLACRFRDSVDAVLAEREISRDVFAGFVRAFVDEQRRHLEEEEAHFFPLAEKVLTAEDWEALATAAAGDSDPLSGGAAAGRFDALRDDILRWEAEDEAGEG